MFLETEWSASSYLLHKPENIWSPPCSATSERVFSEATASVKQQAPSHRRACETTRHSRLNCTEGVIGDRDLERGIQVLIYVLLVSFIFTLFVHFYRKKLWEAI